MVFATILFKYKMLYFWIIKWGTSIACYNYLAYQNKPNCFFKLKSAVLCCFVNAVTYDCFSGRYLRPESDFRLRLLLPRSIRGRLLIKLCNKTAAAFTHNKLFLDFIIYISSLRSGCMKTDPSRTHANEILNKMSWSSQYEKSNGTTPTLLFVGTNTTIPRHQI